MTEKLGLDAFVTGVEFRRDLVDYCNVAAANCNFERLGFVEGTIAGYDAKDIDLLIALHACDTATDDAIAKGIKTNATMIVVAPCCHKQIRKAIEKSATQNALSFITKHGIFLERQAEMITDAIRALILEYFGYKTKVMQFVSDAHTAKNVMIVAERMKGQSDKNEVQEAKRKELILTKIADAKNFFGIEQHYLESQVF